MVVEEFDEAFLLVKYLRILSVGIPIWITILFLHATNSNIHFDFLCFKEVWHWWWFIASDWSNLLPTTINTADTIGTTFERFSTLARLTVDDPVIVTVLRSPRTHNKMI